MSQPVRFDRARCVQHSRYMVALIRHVAAIAVALALSAGNAAVCAGWQATPDARMACCTNGTSCPMHAADRHGHSTDAGVSQVQADSCCAASAQRHDSAAAALTFVASGAIALVPVAVFAIPVNRLAAHGWRAFVPLPVSATPTHLRLSVLLV